jgi:hypothetical protein
MRIWDKKGNRANPDLGRGLAARENGTIERTSIGTEPWFTVDDRSHIVGVR